MIIIFSVIMSFAVNRGYQFIRPKYKQLAKKICLSTQEYLGKGKIEDFIDSLEDPERMYEHDCNELEWLAKNYSWYVSGSYVHHCYIKLDFEDQTGLLLNFEMNDSGTYYIYQIWE